jgi:ABC-type sulfate transport system permease subunit
MLLLKRTLPLSTIDTSKVAVLPLAILALVLILALALVLMLAREADSSWNDLLHALTLPVLVAGILLMSVVSVISLPIVSLAAGIS